MSESQPSRERASAHAVVERILSGEAPLPLRSAAARGALPLQRATLALLYLKLRQDPEESIQRDAQASLLQITPDLVLEILSDPECAPEVLQHFASQAARDEALAEKMAFHPNADARTIQVLASEGNSGVLDLVLTNQERLIATPGLLDRISMNPALRHDQRGRLLDLIGRFIENQDAPGIPEAADDEIGGGSAEEAAKLLDVDVGELFAASEIMDGEEFAQSEDLVVRSAYKKILTLNTAQKAILAMKGGREERLILVRDSNKVVSLSVLKNPRITEMEVESIAAMRHVADEVLRQIGINREWSKSYSILVHLIRNPRTPPSVSTNFVGRLNTKDMKAIAGDRNVPEIIRKMAKRTLDTREQQAASNYRKK